MGRIPHLLCTMAVGSQILAGLGAALFYADLMGLFTGGERIGIAVAAYTVGLIIALGFACLSAIVCLMTAARVPLWRFVAPAPALIATSTFGIWFVSGDPGDAHWLPVAIAVEAAAFVVTAVSAAVARWRGSGTSSGDSE